MKSFFFNKSLLKKSLSVFVIMLMAGFAFAQGKKSVDTKVISIDKHGNLNLDITNSKFAAKGFAASDMVTVKVGNYKFDAPVVQDYSDVENGEFLLRINGEEVSLAINMGNLAGVSGAEIGSSVNITLKDKKGYLITYQLKHLKKSDDRNDYASDEVFANFRQIKMGSIGAGKLYRSCTPVEDGNARAPYAAALFEKNKITAVVNLADSETKYLSWEETNPYCRALYDNDKIMFLSMGASYSTEEFPEKLKYALKFIAENPGETYCIHAKDGKIRTGYICAIIEALCGASMEEMQADYMITFENYYNLKKNKQQYENLEKTIPDMFKYLNGGKNVNAKKLQPTIRKYLTTKVGLTDAELDQIVNNLK
ncbi:MAG: SAM-dependent chlorinase/fluorinase [Treponema sp.]|nr:SAM-dependent chlorinase/fluorinase [Treponema sp.]